MKDQQNFRTLKPITTLDQLVSSYLVAKAITVIREEEYRDVEENIKDNLPELRSSDRRKIDLYYRFSELVNYIPSYVVIAKMGLEEMEEYDFKDSPSITVSAYEETKHLEEAFKSTYSALANITLEDHTLNVFEEAIAAGEKMGRVMQIAMPILAALFHDFGKATKIREEILGDNIGRGYTPHPEVSETFVMDVIGAKFLKVMPNSSGGLIKAISELVKNHHTNSARLKKDPGISLVRGADERAREKEIETLKRSM